MRIIWNELVKMDTFWAFALPGLLFFARDIKRMMSAGTVSPLEFNTRDAKIYVTITITVFVLRDVWRNW